MLSFTDAQLRNTAYYRNAILDGYKIITDFRGEYMIFRMKKGRKETSQSGRIQTYKEFNDQLVIFMQELA
jgi:hypothetical protein